MSLLALVQFLSFPGLLLRSFLQGCGLYWKRPASQSSHYTRIDTFPKFPFSRSDYTQLEDDYKRYITLVEDSYEKMMAAKNSNRASERSKERGTSRRSQKSGKGEDREMSRKISHI